VKQEKRGQSRRRGKGKPGTTLLKKRRDECHGLQGFGTEQRGAYLIAGFLPELKGDKGERRN